MEETMKLKINGDNEVIDQDQLTVTDLLALKAVKMPEMVSVELNGDILDRDQFSTTQLTNEDEVEFLYFMGGGIGAA
jgi:sulfur carrier protein